MSSGAVNYGFEALPASDPDLLTCGEQGTSPRLAPFYSLLEGVPVKALGMAHKGLWLGRYWSSSLSWVHSSPEETGAAVSWGLGLLLLRGSAGQALIQTPAKAPLHFPSDLLLDPALRP